MSTAADAVMRQERRRFRFDGLFRRVERRVTVDDTIEYSTVGVRWYGKGAFIRERLLGADIARKQQWVIRSGDVVYNKLFAWKGAFAVADATVDGHLVSDKFPTYELNTELVEPEFLRHLFLTPSLAFQAERLSKGAAAISKLTLNPPQFWDLLADLPALPEQRSIARRLSEAEKLIRQIEQYRRDADAARDAFMSATITRRLRTFDCDGRLMDVLTGRPRNGWSARCDNEETGVPVLGLGAVTGFHYRPTEFKRTSEPTVAGAHYWLNTGDLLVTRSNTERLVGHAAIYNGQPEPCIYPDLMMKVPVDPAKADTRFVYYWLRTQAVRATLEQAGSGTSSTMKKITQVDLMDLPFPVGVGIEEQRSVAMELDLLTDVTEELKAEQRAAGADVQALWPSFLDSVLPRPDIDETLT